MLWIEHLTVLQNWCFRNILLSIDRKCRQLELVAVAVRVLWFVIPPRESIYGVACFLEMAIVISFLCVVVQPTQLNVLFLSEHTYLNFKISRISQTNFLKMHNLGIWSLFWLNCSANSDRQNFLADNFRIFAVCVDISTWTAYYKLLMLFSWIWLNKQDCIQLSNAKI